MKRTAIVICGIVAFTGTSFAHQPENFPDNEWSIIQTPTTGKAVPIGSYANGCMGGGVALPAGGTGFVDMRRYRNRYYGQPALLTFIYALGTFMNQHHGRKILVGDLSQPRGGRMQYGHSSHQIGLDVDIWLQTVPADEEVSPTRDMQTIVDKAHGTLLSKTLDRPTRDALYFAATYPHTARIFINPIIKLSLCQTEKETGWLRKVRPWWGHDEHFHVRLACPAGADSCKEQNPVPPGSGCTDDLSNWVQEQRGFVTDRIQSKPRVKKKPKPKTLPKQCLSIREQ